MSSKNELITRRVIKEAIVNAKQWQSISKVVAITGYALVVVGLVMVLGGLLEVGLIVAVVGVITKVTSGLFFRRADAAEKRVDTLLKSLPKDKEN